MSPPAFLSKFFRHSSYRRVSEQDDLFPDLISPDFRARSLHITGNNASNFGARFRIRPKLIRLRFHRRGRTGSQPRRIIDHVGARGSDQRRAAVVAVKNFLSGPMQEESEEEKYARQCRELLRKFAASGRVRGYVY